MRKQRNLYVNEDNDYDEIDNQYHLKTPRLAQWYLKIMIKIKNERIQKRINYNIKSSM